MAECQRCSQEFTSHGHTHVHCPRCIGKRFREDITALAEATLFPGIPYVKMVRAQRLLCDEWARRECELRVLPGFGGKRSGRERAAWATG
jgi:tRNA(Ile2) C34 agmatinyltransferase TiaS